MGRKRTNAFQLQQLALSVLTGETAAFPWTLLRSTYFNQKFDSSAMKELMQWASRYGIDVIEEHRKVGPHASERWVRFSVPLSMPSF